MKIIMTCLALLAVSGHAQPLEAGYNIPSPHPVVEAQPIEVINLPVPQGPILPPARAAARSPTTARRHSARYSIPTAGYGPPAEAFEERPIEVINLPVQAPVVLPLARSALAVRKIDSRYSGYAVPAVDEPIEVINLPVPQAPILPPARAVVRSPTAARRHSARYSIPSAGYGPPAEAFEERPIEVINLPVQAPVVLPPARSASAARQIDSRYSGYAVDEPIEVINLPVPQSPILSPPAARFLPSASRFHAQDELGGFSFGYQTPESAKQETRSADGITRGSYRYVDPSGRVRVVEYTADALNGFRVSDGSARPVADTPEVAAAKVEFRRAFDAVLARTRLN